MGKEEVISKHHKSTQTLFILDWDDTLFPTTPFSKQKLTITQIQIIGKYIQNIIKSCQRQGEVHIVTQGSKEWIYLCQLIIRHEINVPIHHVKPHTSKHECFENLIKLYKPHNIITAGDSPHDYTASSDQRHNKLFHNIGIKHIGFKIRPDWEDWEEQMQKVYSILPEMVQKCGHIDALFPNSHTFTNPPGKVSRWIITD